MPLADCIRRNRGAILAEREAFAAIQLPAASGMTVPMQRDPAPHSLEAVAKDLGTPQTREQQERKSKGLVHEPEGAGARAGRPCAEGGTDARGAARPRRVRLNPLVAEYRALRASVQRLWIDAGPPNDIGLQDVIRFNEAIDQALAESVGHFHRQVERAGNLLLGMLGHDMRSPLSTILATASHLAALNAGDDVSVAAPRLIRSGESMQALLDGLVDFTRTNLGLGIRVVPADMDAAAAVADELEQLRSAHPDRRIDLQVQATVAAGGTACACSRRCATWCRRDPL